LSPHTDATLTITGTGISVNGMLLTHSANVALRIR